MSLGTTDMGDRNLAECLTAAPRSAARASHAIPAPSHAFRRTPRAVPLAMLALVFLGSFAGAASAEELRGRIQLLQKGGAGPSRGSDPRQAVVSFAPAGREQVRIKPPDKPFDMVTRQKEFVPRILAVTRGSTVRFPNQDPILHNVFSVSRDNAFDLGLYRDGPGKEMRFDHAGVVRVYCNVHHGMAAYVVVLDTPYFTYPAADGSFALTGLPKGPGTLTVWHEQTDPWTRTVDLPGAPVDARIEVVRLQIPPHLNKSGESYFRNSRDRY